MLRSKSLAAGLIAVLLLSGSALATTITLTDAWSVGTYTPTSGAGPTITIAAIGSSNLGSVTPMSNPHTQTLTLGVPTTNEILFIAAPNGSGVAEIPITFTLGDGTGTATFTLYINYFAKASTDADDMQWTTTPVTPGQGPCGSPSPGAWTSACTAAQLLSLQLVQTITLSDGKQIQVTLPYETDWNMAQQITFDYIGTSRQLPEPPSIPLLGVGAAVLVWATRRRRSHAA